MTAVSQPPIKCESCDDLTRSGLLTCSPRCAVTLAKAFAVTVSHNR